MSDECFSYHLHTFPVIFRGSEWLHQRAADRQSIVVGDLVDDTIGLCQEPLHPIVGEGPQGEHHLAVPCRGAEGRLPHPHTDESGLSECLIA